MTIGHFLLILQLKNFMKMNHFWERLWSKEDSTIWDITWTLTLDCLRKTFHMTWEKESKSTATRKTKRGICRSMSTKNQEFKDFLHRKVSLVWACKLMSLISKETGLGYLRRNYSLGNYWFYLVITLLMLSTLVWLENVTG